nr:hypothetical protein CFP56_16681 [Quercus suber]
MSESSFHAQSLEATSSSDEDFSGVQLDGEDAGRTSPRSYSGHAAHTDRSRSSASKSRSRSTSKTVRRHQGRIRLTDYRNLLNAVITDVNLSQGEAVTLTSSYIGASFWTSSEKKTLFSALALYGRGELSSLANVISTKTVPEVKVFLALLDQGVAETDVTLRSREGFSFVDVPAAIEIGEECEQALDTAADALAQIVRESDLEAEKRKHGECWLIDYKLAIELDECYDESLEVCAETLSDAEEAQDEDVHDPRPQTSGDTSCLTMVPAAGLLRPSSFVRLATDIFMNGPLGTDANWRDHAIDGETEPSVFRTALDDLHNLTVSLTRRLVQATLYQTMSRLRANDTQHSTWRPAEAVNRIDVETATDILGLSVNRDRYWAELPRRTRVAVLSTAPKYKDGREHFNNTVKLTYDEVEAEMGSEPPWTAETSAQDDTDSRRRMFDNDDLDSDWYTDITVSDADEPDLGPESRTSTEHQLANASAPAGSDDMLANANIKPEPCDSDEEGILPKPILSAVSSRNHIKVEDQFLEAIDRTMSYQEERQLWDILGRTPTIKSERVAVPQAPTLKRRADVMADLWRPRTQYQAEWERSHGIIHSNEFHTTNIQGRVQKARRMTGNDERSSSAQRIEVNLPLRGVRPTEVEERYFGDSDDDDNLRLSP